MQFNFFENVNFNFDLKSFGSTGIGLRFQHEFVGNKIFPRPKFSLTRTRYQFLLNTSEILFSNHTDLKSPVYNLNNLTTISYISKKLPLKLGDFVSLGTKIDKTKVIFESGQIIEIKNKYFGIQKAENFASSKDGWIRVQQNQRVSKNTPLFTLNYQILQTEDIVQGIPKIEQLFEARTSFGGKEISPQETLEIFFEFYKQKYSQDQALHLSYTKIQNFLLENIQQVYLAQGVYISDKHLELIIRRMTSTVRIEDKNFLGNIWPLEVEISTVFSRKINILKFASINQLTSFYKSKIFSTSIKSYKSISKKNNFFAKYPAINFKELAFSQNWCNLSRNFLFADQKDNETKVPLFLQIQKKKLRHFFILSKSYFRKNKNPISVEQNKFKIQITKNFLQQKTIEFLVQKNIQLFSTLNKKETIKKNKQSLFKFEKKKSSNTVLPIIQKLLPYKVELVYSPTLRGVTQTSIRSQSFIAAASFQETSRVLAYASVLQKKDFLRGIKERVILGDFIAAGTGFDFSFSMGKQINPLAIFQKLNKKSNTSSDNLINPKQKTSTKSIVKIMPNSWIKFISENNYNESISKQLNGLTNSTIPKFLLFSRKHKTVFPLHEMKINLKKLLYNTRFFTPVLASNYQKNKLLNPTKFKISEFLEKLKTD